MKRATYAFIFLLASLASVLAAPPVEVPPTVTGEVADFVVVRAKTDGVTVMFVALDPGLRVFPSGLLSDRKATVVTAPRAGRYRLLCYSAVGNDPTEPAVIVVIIGDAPDVPPPKPKDPPIVVPPTTAYYFMVVRQDGPAQPEFTRVMGLAAWGELRTKGHKVKDFTRTQATALGVQVPVSSLPVVVTLRENAADGTSTVVGAAIALPTTDDGVRKLTEGK